jgi:hypothetical protein
LIWERPWAEREKKRKPASPSPYRRVMPEVPIADGCRRAIAEEPSQKRMFTNSSGCAIKPRTFVPGRINAHERMGIGL